MSTLSPMKKSIISAMCIALCAVLPLAFHMIPNAGSVLSPMHIPVLLCGLICGSFYGSLCGVMGPLLSHFTTGMPPMPMLPSMMVELAAFGAISGLLIKYVRTKNMYADLYISLITAMLIGRILAGISRALIFTPGGYTISVWVTSYFITALPGIIVQLVLIPGILIALEKARLIPPRYPER